MKRWPGLLFTVLLVVLAACASPQVQTPAKVMPTTSPLATDAVLTPSPAATTLQPTPQLATAAPPRTQAETPVPMPTQAMPTLAPGAWKDLPVIPVVGAGARQIYQRGQELGNNPRAFSKVGDCGSTPAWFLGDFDRGPQFYNLGTYTALGEVIQQFKGSFGRTTLAGKAGFNTASVFTPLWADRSLCQANEAPLPCEYRLHRPSYAFIMLGANDVWHAEQFEPQMRQLIEYSIDQGVIPILATKPDNQEGNGSLNESLARLAMEYDVPLWNFWRAVQDLPDGGLQEDGVHMTWASNDFSDPFKLSRAWPVRNLTALQTLDAVWRAATGQ